MQPGAATKLSTTVLGVSLALFASCAGAPPPAPAAKLSPEQLERCRQLEVAYRAGAPEYPALRDELAKDPVAASWVVRMFVRDVIAAREGRDMDDDREFLAAAAKLEPLLAVRAIAELRTLDAVAVPTLVDDLLRGPQSHQRELGIELLGYLGTSARAPLLKLVREGEVNERRSAARALGRLGVDDEVFAILCELADSRDYRLRADALRGLEGGDERARRFLCERMQGDDDAFVRRMAAQTLGAFPKTETVLAICDYLDRCEREGDKEGRRIGQRALLRLSGTSRVRTSKMWRDWATTRDAQTGRTPLPAANGR